jgi:4-amino-4-deoxy-L-arabinose transferase-like glycosyltransferase
MSSRCFLILLLFLFLLLSAITLPRNPLQNDDAALYALAAKNAVIHNQWLAQFVTPGDLSSFLDKPPLGIWLLAWPMQLFGVSELMIHVPNVIYFVLLLALIYFTLARLSSKKLAFYSTLIAATSLCLVVYSRAPKLDVLITLFVFTAHISLYAFLKKDNPAYLFLFTLSLACGFLVKSGFGVLLPGLTILFLLLFNAVARKKLFGILLSRYLFLNVFLFLALVGGILSLQRFVLHDQWLPYLKSITLQSKYNVGYLGLGINYSIIGFLLILLFPWSPLWLTALKLPKPLPPFSPFPVRVLTLRSFCNFWFWSNFIFLLFFYRQNDLRTFTVFVPPLAILAGLGLISLDWKPRRLVAGLQLFFFVLFSVILIAAVLNPVNPQGFSLVAAIAPMALFVISLFALLVYFLKPSAAKLLISFFLIILSYSVLFYNTKPIADTFNQDVKWPGIIKQYRDKGVKFYIYRPPDRKLFYSPDLFWVDFMVGPADQYFWNKETLIQNLATPAIVLSDSESWEKLHYQGKSTLLAKDNYSLLLKIN